MKTFLQSIILSCVLISGITTAASKAPELNLSDTNGKMVQLANYQGKVVYLDFWATWCVPCRKSFPWMNDMLSQYQSQGLEIIAVSLDEKRKMVENFLKKFPANFTIALDPEGKTADLYKVRGMPSSYIIDRQGNIVETHMGFRKKDKEKLELLLKEALKAS